jgi:membrane fusion protein (multidrug efflux system)
VITTLDDDAVMKLDFAVPSLYLPSLAPGVRIEARSEALGDAVFDGEIASIDSRVDPVTRTIQVRALLENDERALRPGLLMRVELLRNPRDALMIPESALLQRGDAHSVMLIGDRDGTLGAEQRTVSVGLRRPGEVEVTDGLAPGDRVVTHGADKVRPDQPLEIMALDDGTRPLSELLAQPADAAADAGRTP